MRDHLLFAVLPYIGGALFVAGTVVPLARRRVISIDVPTPSRGALGTVWRWAFAIVAIGHVLTLAFPGVALRWDRDFSRLVLFEGTQVVAGGIAVAGAVAALVGLLGRPQAGRPRALDVVAATLLVVATVSGLVIAIAYRWASAWSTVTLAPYLWSLARFAPSTDLVTHLPVLVKLHVVSSIVILMVLPFTSPARAIATRFARGRRAET